MKKAFPFTAKNHCIIAAIIAFAVIGCSQKEQRLPYLGNPIVENNDTIYPKIADFKFTDQDNQIVTNKTFENKIYVADFIFLSCPTICPKMTSELQKVYAVYKTNPTVQLLSHTIDPENDTIERLKLYSESIGITNNWYFVTGEKENIYTIAEKSYFTTAYKDTNEPGGYVHGGGLVLVDNHGHIRGVYDGTNTEETKRLIADIGILLKELKA